MLGRRLRLGIVVPVLLAIAAVAFMAVNEAANASTSPPKVVWGDKQCLSCHSDLATLKKMQWKKDDPTFCQAAYDKLQKEQSSNTPAAPGWYGSNPKK